MASEQDHARMRLLVAEVRRHGSLAHLDQTTITIGGKRRHYLRVQSAILTRLYHGHVARRSDGFLEPLIDGALESEPPDACPEQTRVRQWTLRSHFEDDYGQGTVLSGPQIARDEGPIVLSDRAPIVEGLREIAALNPDPGLYEEGWEMAHKARRKALLLLADLTPNTKEDDDG